jgi:hypothetical protein
MLSSVPGRTLRPRVAERGGELRQSRRADEDPAPEARLDELGHPLVPQQLALADHDQVISGNGHLAHEVTRYDHRAAVGGKVPHQPADPHDALGVQAVNRLVKHQYRRIPEQGRRDPQELAHSKGEAAYPPPRYSLEADESQHLIDPASGDAVALGQAKQMVIGRSARVYRLGVDERADIAQRSWQVPVAFPADSDIAAGGAVEPQHQPHGGGLACPVRPDEAGDQTRIDGRTQIVNGQRGPVLLAFTVLWLRADVVIRAEDLLIRLCSAHRDVAQHGVAMDPDHAIAALCRHGGHVLTQVTSKHATE